MQPYERRDEIAPPSSDPMSDYQHPSQSLRSQTLEPLSTNAGEQLPSWLIFLLHTWRQHRLFVVLCSSGVVIVPTVAQVLPSFINPLPTVIHHQSASRLDYELLEIGMTATDAQARLGQAVEYSRNETTVTYKWSKNDTEITAVFKNDRLISKEQSHLK